MLIKPDLKDEEIIACLRDAYGLTIEKVVFLPLGADFNTAVYRVTTTDGADHFLKLRSGKFLEASVSVPKYLADLGIKQVISALATKTGQLWSPLGVLTYKRHQSLTGNKENSTSIESAHQLNSRELMKYNRVERDTSRIFAMEALDTFLLNNILISSSFPSNLDGP